MPSFRTSLTPHRRAAARFVVGVRHALQRALAEEGKSRGLTQTAIADALGVHRSVVSRELRGVRDMSLGRVAELSAVMGLEPHFELRRLVVQAGRNTPVEIEAAPATPAASIASGGVAEARKA